MDADATKQQGNANARAASDLKFRLPRQELDRRWAASRQILRAQSVDAVVTVGYDDSLSGYVRWFCDFGSTGYMKVAIFFAEGPMTIVEHGPLEAVRPADPGDPDTPGVDTVMSTATFKSVASTFLYEAQAVARRLGDAGARRVGLLRPGGMPHAFVEYLKTALPGVEWCDLTDAFDQVKAVKSPTELDVLRQGCKVQDEVFALLLEQIRPGVREDELVAFAERELRLRGAIDGTLMGGSAPCTQPALPKSWRTMNRTLQQGDCFTILLELSDAAGYYGELARQVVLGRATDDHHAAFAVVKEAQDATVARFRPGTSCAEIAEAHDQFMLARGRKPEGRLYSHSQGYDMVERPLIRRDETMRLEAGMFLSCHPVVFEGNTLAFLCDDFIIHADGAERVHSTAQKIFEI